MHKNLTRNGEPQRYSWGTQKKKNKVVVVVVVMMVIVMVVVTITRKVNVAVGGRHHLHP